MIENCTQCIWSARFPETWIYAQVALARLAGAAVVVVVTTEDTGVTYTNVTKEAIIVEPTCENTASVKALFIESTTVV